MFYWNRKLQIKMTGIFGDIVQFQNKRVTRNLNQPGIYKLWFVHLQYV